MTCKYQNLCRLYNNMDNMLSPNYVKHVCDNGEEEKSVCFCPEYMDISGLEALVEDVDMIFDEACRLYDTSARLRMDAENLLQRANLAEKRAFLKKEALDPNAVPRKKL